MTITIAVPAHNEAEHLEKNIHTLHHACSKFFVSHAWNIVIAENGSTDQTAPIARQLMTELPQVSVRSSAIPGKGCAITDAWNSHPADIYIFLDADLSTHTDDFPVLIRAVDQADIVIGSRTHPFSKTARSFSRTILSFVYNSLVTIFLGLTHQDHQCGFKAIRATAWKQLRPHIREDGFLFDTELLVAAHKLRLTVTEIPVHWEEERTRGRKSQVKFLRSAIIMLVGLYRLRRRMRHFLIK